MKVLTLRAQTGARAPPHMLADVAANANRTPVKHSPPPPPPPIPGVGSRTKSSRYLLRFWYCGSRLARLASFLMHAGGGGQTHAVKGNDANASGGSQHLHTQAG